MKDRMNIKPSIFDTDTTNIFVVQKKTYFISYFVAAKYSVRKIVFFIPHLILLSAWFLYGHWIAFLISMSKIQSRQAIINLKIHSWYTLAMHIKIDCIPAKTKSIIKLAKPYFAWCIIYTQSHLHCYNPFIAWMIHP